MIRRVLLALALLAVFGAGGMILYLAPPPYPKSWDNLELGFTESEAKAAVPELNRDFREVKGFDQAGVDYGDRYWVLIVIYDPSGRVSMIEKKYVHEKSGLRNRSLVESR